GSDISTTESHVTVSSSRRLVDNCSCYPVYPVTKDSMSNRIALLINNIDFNGKMSKRNGAEQDQQAMLKLLGHLQYEVVLHQDLTAEGIDQALIKFSKHSKLIKTDSVFVVVMSHGGFGTISGSDQVDFEIDKIYECLNTKNCPDLRDKPKVIIIQACRGANAGVVEVDLSRQSLATENIGSPSENAKAGVVHVEKDFIGFHSSTRYTSSYRHPNRGSHFIHHICDVFRAVCCQDHIEELCMRLFSPFSAAPRGLGKFFFFFKVIS
uniref:Caspase family p20 domain-containing protein n=1 Tax=Pundamilia nyererei TaxID=303518 RepID=A0A3B4EV16_9CICH